MRNICYLFSCGAIYPHRIDAIIFKWHRISSSGEVVITNEEMSRAIRKARGFGYRPRRIWNPFSWFNTMTVVHTGHQ